MQSLFAKHSLLKWLNYLFWFLTLFVYPLAHNPYRFPELRAVWLHPKGILLTAVVLLGIVLSFLIHPQSRLVKLPRAFLTLPRPLQLMLLFIAVLAISGMLVSYEIAGITWIGSSDRLDGVFMQMGWYFLAVLAFVVARSGHVPLSHIVSIAVAGGCTTVAWYLLEVYGFGPAVYLVDHVVSINDADGTMGSEALIAGYAAVILVVFLIYRYASSSFLYRDFFVVFLLTAGIIATGNRAAPLASIVTLLGFTGFAWAKFKKPLPRRHLVATITTLCIATLFSVITIEQPYQVSETIRALQGQDGSTNVRLTAWRVGLDIAVDHPWLGFGPNGLRKAAWQYLRESEREYMIENYLPQATVSYMVPPLSGSIVYRMPDGVQRTRMMPLDKAHNYFIDLAATSGFIGLGLFIAMGYFAISCLLKAGQPLGYAVAAGLITYGIFGMAWFATLTVDPIIWTLVGVGLAATPIEDSLADVESYKRTNYEN